MSKQTEQWETALREYERAHAVWFNTVRDTADGRRAELEMSDARERYVNAVKAAKPDWIVI